MGEPGSAIASGMAERKNFTVEEARRIGEQLGIDWSSAPFDIEQFRMGMDVELEHGLHDLLTNVTDDDPVVTGKIALAHLNRVSGLLHPAGADGGGGEARTGIGLTAARCGVIGRLEARLSFSPNSWSATR